MASSRRTYDTDVITLRTVFAKNPGNSNIPGLRVLTADGQGGTYWAVPSSLGVYPSFNEIVTSAATYTADLSYNTFRLTAGENIGMVDGSPGSNETLLYAKAFSQLDISGENTIYAYTGGQLDSSVTLAGQNGITLRGDPATNTLFIVGPTSNAYTLSTGIYGFNQIKVTEAASSITSSILGWDGTYLTATSPSTLLRFIGYNDIQLSTNVTTNSVFFTISTFTSKGYLDISTTASVAYPNAISTVSSLYTPLNVFNSTVQYLSTNSGLSFSSVQSSILALALSTGDQFYILTGLINARATIVQLNNEISNVNTNIQSTSVGLGTLGYISTGGGSIVASPQLVSTVEGLGTAGYVSTAGAGDVVKANLFSTVAGLGSAGYISSLSTIITSTIFNTGAISTYSLEVFGPATLTNSGSTILRGALYVEGALYTAGAVGGASGTIVNAGNLLSTTAGLGQTYVSSTALTSTVRGLGTSQYVSSSQLASTVANLGTSGYVSSSSLYSSLRGLGSLGYLSALRGFSVSSGNIFVSSLNLLDVYTNAVNFITISSGSLLVNGVKIEGGGGGGGGGGGVAQLVAGTNISLSPPGGTGIVTINNTGPTQTDVNNSISSFSTSLGGSFYNFSTVSTNYASSFVTVFLQASTMTTANILPSQSNLWVAVGYGSTTPNSIQYSGDGSNWSNSTTGGFSLAGKSVAYNGSLWVAVGNNGGATGSIQVSTDGRNWTNAVSGGFSSGGNGVAYNGSRWVAVGNNGGSATTSIQTSTDGRSWSGITAGGFSIVAESVAWNGSYWVAVGQGASTAASIQYSIDGQTWVSATTGGFSAGGRGIAWNGVYWVAVGDDVTRAASIQYSGDGRNWSNVTTGGFVSAGNKVSWNGRLWVAVGDDNVTAKSIQLSIDGSNWSDLNTGGFSGDGFGIAWNGFYWVATGGAGSAVGSLQTSRDGSNWTNASSGGFASGGVGVGFSSNLRPGYAQQGLTILSQNIPLYLNSTNQIFAQPSSLLIDNTLLVDGQVKRVGVNCNTPGVDLDVGGIGRFLTLSTQAFNLSSINGANYISILPSTVAGLGTSLYVSTASLASTTSNLASSIAGIQYNYQTAGFLSTASLASTTTNLASSIAGIQYNYQTAGFLSTASLASTTTNLASSIAGIQYNYQTAGFLSTASLASTTTNLASSIAGIQYNYQTAGFLSTASLASTTTNLASSIAGIQYNYQTAGFLSTASLASTTTNLASSIAGIQYNYQTAGFLSTASLASTTTNLASSIAGIQYNYQTAGFLSTASLASTTTNLASSIAGIQYNYQTAGFLSTTSLASTTAGVQVNLNSTVAGLGTWYISSLINVNTLSSLVLNVSSINGAVPGTGSGTAGAIPFLSAFTLSTGSIVASSIGINASSPQFSLDVNGTVNLSTLNSLNLYTRKPGDFYLAVGVGNGIRRSANGIAWTTVTTPYTTNTLGIGWNGKYFLLLGQDSTNNVKYSFDGSNWSNTGSSGMFTQAGDIFSPVWNGRYWLIAGYDTTNVVVMKRSFDGLNWQNCTGVFSLGTRCAAWNGFMWVAVGLDATANNTIKYSYDGISWSNSSGTGFTAGGSGGGQSVAWNGKMWVAAGFAATQLATLKYSYDGITWSNAISGGFNGTEANCVIWTGRLWYAGGKDSTNQGSTGNNTIQYSVDGINWTGVTQGFATISGNTPSCAAIVFYNNLYVATGYGGGTGSANVQRYSTDGLTFTVGTGSLFSDYGWQNQLVYTSNAIPMYKQEELAIYQQNIPSYYFSTNSILPQLSSMILNNTLTIDAVWDRVGINTFTPQTDLDVAGTGRFQVLSTLAVNVSSMGVNTNRPSFALDVAGTGRFQILSTLALNVSSLNGALPGTGSGNGSSLTVSTGYMYASSMNFVNLAPTTSNLWVAVGNDSSANIKYSGDGINWSPATGGFTSGEGRGVAWNGRLWVAVGNPGVTASIKYSFNGITWTDVATNTFGAAGYGVAWNGRIWVAVGWASPTAATIKYSSDGITWTNSTSGGFSESGRGVAWNGRMWVAVGYAASAGSPNTTIKYSFDGITWSDSASGGFAQYGHGVAWNGRLWVAVGTGATASETIKYSYDGSNWSNTVSNGFASVVGYGVGWNGRMWQAVGEGTVIKYSFDGLSWTNATGFSSRGEGVAWNGSLWVAVGLDGTQNNTIKYSLDGINWSNSSGTGFTQNGYGVAFSSNVIPGYSQTNFEIESQNIPNFLTSTNQLSFLASTIIVNNVAFIDGTGRVGINTTIPQTDLDVGGVGRFQTLSTFLLNTSSINTSNINNTLFVTSNTNRIGIQCNNPPYPLTVNGLTGMFASTLMFNTTITSQNTTGRDYAPSVLTLGGGTSAAGAGEGFFYGPTIRSVIPSGSFQDQIRLDLTTSRATNDNTQITRISVLPGSGGSGFVGIHTSTPAVTLDVAGTGRFQVLSTLRFAASSINTGLLNTSSLTSVSSISFGTGTGWVVIGAVQTAAISSIQQNTAASYISSLYCGSTTTILPGYTAWLNGPSRINQLLIGQASTVTQQPSFDLHLINNSAVKPLTTTWTVGSDMRVKENIVDADTEICYSNMKEIRLRRFAWQSSFFESASGYDRHVLGFVAQEISTIVPKAIETKEAYGYSNFHFLNIEQLNMTLYGSVKKIISDKEHMESTIKGQRIQIETLEGRTNCILSTLEGLQGR